MKKAWMLAAVVVAVANLTGCNTMNQQPTGMAYESPRPQNQALGPNGALSQNQPGQGPINQNMSGGGEIAAASFGGMSASDRNKLAHALDATPGRSTHWTNMATGVTYTVTPIRKVVINNNHLCREYQTSAIRNGQRQDINGTACITDDGNWHNINNL